MIEARCLSCGDHFIPTEDDLVEFENGRPMYRHYTRWGNEHEGEECGGLGHVRGIPERNQRERKVSMSEQRSVLQDWVMELPLRCQGTLLTAVRGCDVAPKYPLPADDTYVADNGRAQGAERELTAFFRYCTMNPADEREVDVPGAFFQSRPPADWKASQFGHYPQHWYAHLMHAFEVIGYLHPDEVLRSRAINIYLKLVYNLHLNIESKGRMMERLTEDRIATGTIVS